MRKSYTQKNLSRKAKKNPVGVLAFGVCLGLFVLLIGGAIGRYQKQLSSEASVRAKEFYFVSDFLDGGTHTLAPGSTEVSFTLRNHADELRYSEMEIAYSVTVTGGNGTAATVDPGTGTLGNTGAEDKTVTVSNLQPGTYTVTATGNGGYEKTLTATVVVPGTAARLYQHREYVSGEYLLLTVWNEGDTAGTVTVAYKGIPDNTNPNMTDWQTGGETDQNQVETIEPHTSKVYRFFGEQATVSVTDASSTELEKKIPD